MSRREVRLANLVWSVRKAGLSLLTGCVGAAKPVAFIEDAAVRPPHLRAFRHAPCTPDAVRAEGISVVFLATPAEISLWHTPQLAMRAALKAFQRSFADQEPGAVIDGAAGLRAENSNLADDVTWPEYRARLEMLAARFL